MKKSGLLPGLCRRTTRAERKSKLLRLLTFQPRLLAFGHVLRFCRQGLNSAWGTTGVSEPSCPGFRSCADAVVSSLCRGRHTTQKNPASNVQTAFP